MTFLIDVDVAPTHMYMNQEIKRYYLSLYALNVFWDYLKISLTIIVAMSLQFIWLSLINYGRLGNTVFVLVNLESVLFAMWNLCLTMPFRPSIHKVLYFIYQRFFCGLFYFCSSLTYKELKIFGFLIFGEFSLLIFTCPTAVGSSWWYL